MRQRKKSINSYSLHLGKKNTTDNLSNEFNTFPIDRTISQRVGKIVMFTADNEHQDGKEGLKMFHEALGGKIINIPGYGHYIMRDMKTEEFPELIKEVLE